MKRREFIALLGGTAFAYPHPLWAQQSGKIPRVGIIDDSPIWNPFRETLRELGYVEGRNIAFEYRYAGGLPDRLVWVAADLVRRPVDLIATSGTPAAYAAKHATTTIPIVMIGVGDPVGAGLVSSLARPGGNVTGNTILAPDVAGKRLQLLMEAVPHLSRVAFLWNPDNASHPAQLAELQKAVEILRVKLLPVAVRNSDELLNALNAMTRERPEGFLMTNDPLHQLAIGTIIDFLATNRLPGMYISREIVMAGGFLSYGPSLPDLFRRGAGYAHRILQGAKPADLPVEQPIKFELVINLKAAKAMGLDVPPTFLARADDVIE
jgi:putative tryptophan/tyrosine transport system substrate-binding protein